MSPAAFHANDRAWTRKHVKRIWRNFRRVKAVARTLELGVVSVAAAAGSIGGPAIAAGSAVFGLMVSEKAVAPIVEATKALEGLCRAL